jgi:hypothetical protein
LSGRQLQCYVLPSAWLELSTSCMLPCKDQSHSCYIHNHASTVQYLVGGGAHSPCNLAAQAERALLRGSGQVAAPWCLPLQGRVMGSLWLLRSAAKSDCMFVHRCAVQRPLGSMCAVVLHVLVHLDRCCHIWEGETTPCLPCSAARLLAYYFQAGRTAPVVVVAMLLLPLPIATV